jgi:hypothetical protein
MVIARLVEEIVHNAMIRPHALSATLNISWKMVPVRQDILLVTVRVAKLVTLLLGTSQHAKEQRHLWLYGKE